MCWARVTPPHRSFNHTSNILHIGWRQRLATVRGAERPGKL